MVGIYHTNVFVFDFLNVDTRLHQRDVRTYSVFERQLKFGLIFLRKGPREDRIVFGQRLFLMLIPSSPGLFCMCVRPDNNAIIA